MKIIPPQTIVSKYRIFELASPSSLLATLISPSIIFFLVTSKDIAEAPNTLILVLPPFFLDLHFDIVNSLEEPVHFSMKSINRHI